MLVKCDGAGREQPPSLLSGAVGIDKSVAEGVFWEWGGLVIILCSESQPQTRPWSFTKEDAHHVRLIKHWDLSGYPEGPEAAEEAKLARARQLPSWWICSSYFPNKSSNIKSFEVTAADTLKMRYYIRHCQIFIIHR